MKLYAGHDPGYISEAVKQMVRAAIDNIRHYRMNGFEVTEKLGYDGKKQDFFTDADTSTQQLYAGQIDLDFPGFGIIGEEALSQPCTLSHDTADFIIDPLDG